jgi:hypothetical protein
MSLPRYWLVSAPLPESSSVLRSKGCPSALSYRRIQSSPIWDHLLFPLLLFFMTSCSPSLSPSPIFSVPRSPYRSSPLRPMDQVCAFDRSLGLGCVNSPVGSGSFIKRSVLSLLLGTSKLRSGIATGSRTIYTNWLEGPSPLEGESCQDLFRVIMGLAYLLTQYSQFLASSISTTFPTDTQFDFSPSVRFDRSSSVPSTRALNS